MQALGINIKYHTHTNTRMSHALMSCVCIEFKSKIENTKQNVKKWPPVMVV